MKPRVLFYVQHLLGVGHVKRAAAIARAAAELVELHVVLGGEPVALADFGRATVHQLPPARAEDLTFKTLLDADGRPIDDAWRVPAVWPCAALADRLDPQVLLVEHFPFGRGKFAFELLPLFEQMRAKPGRRILCSVRDVLVEKDDGAKSEKILRLVRRWFDGVLVHGDRSVIPFAATFPAAAGIEDLLEYTGYVVDGGDVSRPRVGWVDEGGPTTSGNTRECWASQDRSTQPTDRLGAAPSRGPNAEIVISIGGGAVGKELLQAALDAAQSGALSPRHWRLLAGGNLPEPVFQALRAKAAGDAKATVERARPDFRQLLAGAGLSISQAGYNTVMDILIAGCPGLVIPFAAETESEQLFRAREFERRGLLTVLEEAHMNPATLVTAAQSAIAAKGARDQLINLDGARGTADALARWAGAA
jgi:predicted glycosyltransferase